MKVYTKSLFHRGDVSLNKFYHKILDGDFSGLVSDMSSVRSLQQKNDFLFSLDVDKITLEEFNDFFKNNEKFVLKLDKNWYKLDQTDALFLRVDRRKKIPLMDALFFRMKVDGYDIKVSLNEFNKYLQKLGKNIKVYDYKNLQGFKFLNGLIPVNDLGLFGLVGEHQEDLKFVFEDELLAVRLRQPFDVFLDGNQPLYTVITDGSHKRKLVLISLSKKKPYFLHNRRYSHCVQQDYFAKNNGLSLDEYEDKPVEHFLSFILPFYRKVA